jgi:Fic family protein
MADEDRSAYYRALERSQTGQDDLPFLRWFFCNYLAKNRGPTGTARTKRGR